MWLSDRNTVWPKENSSLLFLFALNLFAIFFDMHLRRRVGGIRSGFVDASLTSQPGSSRQAHTQEEGCCLCWQPLRCPPGALIGCQSSACERANRTGGRVGTAGGNLTACPPSRRRYWCFSSSPECGGGKLYRPKGRLTSLEPWNGSDSLLGVGVRATVIHWALTWKGEALSDVLVVFFFITHKNDCHFIFSELKPRFLLKGLKNNYFIHPLWLGFFFLPFYLSLVKRLCVLSPIIKVEGLSSSFTRLALIFLLLRFLGT